MDDTAPAAGVALRLVLAPLDQAAVDGRRLAPLLPATFRDSTACPIPLRGIDSAGIHPVGIIDHVTTELIGGATWLTGTGRLTPGETTANAAEEQMRQHGTVALGIELDTDWVTDSETMTAQNWRLKGAALYLQGSDRLPAFPGAHAELAA